MPAASARLSAGRRREQLLDVTGDLVVESSFHEISIDAVARRAGVSRPVVYAHFTDLGALLAALIERESAAALADLARFMPVASEGRPAREVLLEGLRAYLEAVRSRPKLWRLVLMPPEGAPQNLREGIATARRAVISGLSLLLGGAAGPARSPDPELTARMLSTFADECARLVLTEPAGHSTDRVLKLASWALERLLPDPS